MILRAKHENNVLIFELEGHLDFESTQHLEDACNQMMKNKGCGRVVFDMERLRFVGSSGINHFIRVLKEFNSLEEKPRLCKVSSEFQKILKAFQTTRNPFEFVESIDNAISSFETDSLKKTTPKKNSKGIIQGGSA